MKGIIFRGLESLVVKKYGMAVWDQLLEKNAPDQRVYISAESYPDPELFSLATDVADFLSLPLPDVLRAFGEYLFGYLLERHPIIMAKFSNFDELMMGIDSVIHAEVAKLYNEPNLPKVKCEKRDSGLMVVHYYSVRKLCLCAEGLIYGAASHYGIEVRLEHIECMHNGASECVIEVKYGGVTK